VLPPGPLPPFNNFFFNFVPEIEIHPEPYNRSENPSQAPRAFFFFVSCWGCVCFVWGVSFIGLFAVFLVAIFHPPTGKGLRHLNSDVSPLLNSEESFFEGTPPFFPRGEWAVRLEAAFDFFRPRPVHCVWNFLLLTSPPPPSPLIFLSYFLLREIPSIAGASHLQQQSSIFLQPHHPSRHPPPFSPTLSPPPTGGTDLFFFSSLLSDNGFGDFASGHFPARVGPFPPSDPMGHSFSRIA